MKPYPELLSYDALELRIESRVNWFVGISCMLES